MTINVNSNAYVTPSTVGAPEGGGVAAAHNAGREFDGTAYVGTAPPGNPGTAGVADLPVPDDSRFSDAGVLGAINHLGSLGAEQVSADIYAFMALFQKLAQSMRDTARMQRDTATQAQVSALQNAADKMKTAAEARFSAAIAQAAMQIVGGVMQAGLSTASMVKTVQGAGLGNQGKDMLAQAKDPKLSSSGQIGLKTQGNDLIRQSDIATGRGAGLMNFGTASSGISAGIGGCISAHFTKDADMADSERARFDAQAKLAETGQQQANDAMQQMMDIIRDVREKLQSIQQAAIETNRGIARNV